MKIAPLWKQLFTERLLKATVRTPSQFNLPPNAIRFAIEKLCWALPKNKDVKIRPLKISGLDLEEIKAQAEATQLIFHIHGGAFFLGSLHTHRAFLTHVAARTQMQILHVDYPLSPENPFPEALDALLDVYQALLAQGVQAKDIILSGDSCGANLAVALALEIRKLELPQVSGLILMSPLLDLTLTSESLRYNQAHDALLSIEALETGIDYYLPRNVARDDPQVSPYFADLTGLPPILIQVGSKEILLDDGKRFYEKAKEAGVKASFKLYTGMWHNFQMFTMFEEAQAALADLSEFAHHLDVD